ncbi:hypothetical protein QCA50_004862 [Cerrena zonata]|uniref:EXPERA domain-containing protein n=1 Tax=Cerrena zonata TaxID=2478898 RepID=A0AAW0GD79_9APHY
MYRPLLSSTLSARIEREAPDFHERLQSHSRAPSTATLNGPRLNEELDKTEHEDWETETYVDGTPTSSQSSRAPSTVEMAEHEETRGQKTDTHPRLGNPLQIISHALSRTMAVKTHTFVSLWFLLTIPIIFWDAGYCFMRPRSMRGGDLHWIWKPYELYQEIDLVYGVKALENGDGFTNAQSLLNIVENFMNIGYLYLAHVSGSPAAPLLGFASAVMTLSKTVLYWAQEFYCGGCAVGHNDLQTLIIYWIIPNGLWLIVPSFIISRLSKDILASLRATDQAVKKEKSGKKL